jgi:hypothetical protein
VTYDISDNDTRRHVADELEELRGYADIGDSTYLVATSHSASDIRDLFTDRGLDSHDWVMVSEVDGDWAAAHDEAVFEWVDHFI